MTAPHNLKRTLATIRRAARRLTFVPVLSSVLFACGEKVGPPVDTALAVRNTGWGNNVTITFGDGNFRFRSNGIPNHTLQAEYVMPDNFTSCVPHPTPSCTHVEPVSMAIQTSSLDFTIPAMPQKLTETFSLPFGAMGVIISGSTVYNPYEGDGKTVAMNANFTIPNQKGQPVAFMDSCNGHPSPHPAGQYHYHGLPSCVTAQVDQKDGPSHIIGYAFDGFPVYGDRDISGQPVKPESLDECNGIESPTPEFPSSIYHYVLLEVPTVQSTIRCLHGKPGFPLPSP